jgi:hypothetical protein
MVSQHHHHSAMVAETMVSLNHLMLVNSSIKPYCPYILRVVTACTIQLPWSTSTIDWHLLFLLTIIPLEWLSCTIEGYCNCLSSQLSSLHGLLVPCTTLYGSFPQLLIALNGLLAPCTAPYGPLTQSSKFCWAIDTTYIVHSDNGVTLHGLPVPCTAPYGPLSQSS